MVQDSTHSTCYLENATRSSTQNHYLFQDKGLFRTLPGRDVKISIARWN